jgi:hypothetical protein
MKCPNCEKEFSHEGNVLLLKVQPLDAFHWTDEETPKRVALRREPFPCPSCPAMIKTGDRFRRLNNCKHSPVLSSLLLGPFLAVGIFFTVSDTTGEYYSEFGLLLGLSMIAIFLIPTGVCISISVYASSQLHYVNRWEVACMRQVCQHCGTVAALEDAEFCPTCGASLPTAITTTTISKDCVGTQKLGNKAPKVESVETCLVCDLEMNPADLLARCPLCGNVFHKSHLVTWVHLKKRCPACGERLAESEIITVSNKELTRVEREEGAR